MPALLNILIQLVIAGLIFYLVWWFVEWVGIPEPFHKVVKVVLGLLALIFLIHLLLGVSGTNLFK